MATRAEIEETYNYMDEIFRESFGEHADLSCAFFDGDLGKTLEQAQRDKHRLILDQLRIGPGSRVLDVGCGWGPLLEALGDRGAHGVGITLSTPQQETCLRGGYECYLMDWRDVTPATFGTFDGVTAIGSPEHFCSPDEYRAGLQDQVYARFFQLCSSLLRDGGRVYVQSMVWGRNAPAFEAISLDAPKGSNAYMTALLGAFYPGTFVAFGAEQLIRCASPWFREVYRSEGRDDYIATMDRWGAYEDWSPRKLWLARKLLWPYLTDAGFRRKIAALRAGNNRECFRRDILTLCRLVLEKT